MARSPGHPLLGIIESISKPPCVIVTYSPLPLSFKQDKKHDCRASSSPGFCDFSFWAAHSQHSRSVLDEAKLTKTPPYRRAHRQRLFISVSLNITLASLVFQPIYLFSANILYSFSVSLHSGLSLHRTTSSHSPTAVERQGSSAFIWRELRFIQCVLQHTWIVLASYVAFLPYLYLSVNTVFPILHIFWGQNV